MCDPYWGGAVGKDFAYRIFGKGFLRGPEIHPDGDEYDGWHMMRAGFRTDWTDGKDDTLTVQGDIYRGTTPRRVGLLNTNWPTGNVDVRMANFLSQAQQKWTISAVPDAGGYPGSPYFKITVAGTGRTLAGGG